MYSSTRNRHPAQSSLITEGVIWKQILFFFFPILFGTFFQQLYNTADAIIVGRFVGTQALAAVGGASGQLIHFFVNLFVGLSSGTSVAASQAFGAHDHENLSRAVHTSAAMALAAGAFLTVFSIAATPFALRAMDTPADILDASALYLRIYMLGTVPSFLYNVGSGILRAVGDTRRPLQFLVAGCLSNIALDILLVAVLKTGIAGAALASVLSQCISAALVLRCLIRTDAPYRMDVRRICFHAPTLAAILKVGVPTGIQSNMCAVSNIIIQSSINSFGTATVAACTAFGKVDSFFWMILGAYGISITTFAGQNFGAQKYSRIRKSVRVCLCMGLATAGAMSVLFCLFSPQLIGLFSADENVIAIGCRVMACRAPFYAVYVCVEIFSGAARGVGSALVPTLLTCGGVCALRVVWVFCVMPYFHSLDVLMFSYPVSWVLTAFLFILYYLHGGWLAGRIKKLGYAPEVRSTKK